MIQAWMPSPTTVNRTLSCPPEPDEEQPSQKVEESNLDSMLRFSHGLPLFLIPTLFCLKFHQMYSLSQLLTCPMRFPLSLFTLTASFGLLFLLVVGVL